MLARSSRLTLAPIAFRVPYLYHAGAADTLARSSRARGAIGSISPTISPGASRNSYSSINALAASRAASILEELAVPRRP